MKLLLATTMATVLHSRGTQAQDGPAQYCRDDAGPPWQDDAETFPGGRYHDSSSASPHLVNGECPAMLTDACAAKPAKAAFLEGPLQCGGRGWFCRIVHQPGWSRLGSDGKNSHGDDNFQHCNATRDWDGDGHCHGSDTDSTYGWWVRDHWFRNYPGRLHCCCGWATSEGSPMPGLVDRCDYRRPVQESEAGECRDANEDHNRGYDGVNGRGCPGGNEAINPNFQEPLTNTADQCWTISNFAPGYGQDDDDEGGGGSPGEGDDDEGGGGSPGEEDDDEGGSSPGEEDDDEEGDKTYVLNIAGTCGGTEAQTAVTSRDECAEAAEDLDLSDVTTSRINSANRPPGCFFKPSNARQQLYWNANMGADRVDRQRPVICRTTGDEPPPSFALREVGNCNGAYDHVASESECEEAAEALDLEDTTATLLEDKPSRPHGCYYKEDNRRRKLYFNAGGDRDSNDTTRVSVCGVNARRDRRVNLEAEAIESKKFFLRGRAVGAE